MKKVSLFTLVLAFFVTGCGKDAQEGTRSFLEDELVGKWATACVNNSISSITVSEDKQYTTEKTTYFDADCTEKKATVSQAGTVRVALSRKDNVKDVMVVDYASEATFTIHDAEVTDSVNKELDRQQKIAEEKPLENLSGEPLRLQKDKNNRARAVKAMTRWGLDEAKTMNRLQIAELEGPNGVIGLIVPLKARDSSSFSLDNETLSFGGASDQYGSSAVFVKAK